MSEPVTKMESKDRSSLERTMESAVRRLLGKGIATKVRLLTSLRVGSGAAAEAALDGTDGAIMADGASAALLARDRNDATKYVSLYRNNTIRLGTEAADLWLITAATGIIAPAVSAVSGGVGFTNSWANFGNGNDAGYWKDIHGVVHLEGTIKSGTITAAAFTLPAGFRPLATKGYACDSNAAFGELIVNTTGTVVPNTGSNVYFILDGVTFRTV